MFGQGELASRCFKQGHFVFLHVPVKFLVKHWSLTFDYEQVYVYSTSVQEPWRKNTPMILRCVLRTPVWMKVFPKNRSDAQPVIFSARAGRDRTWATSSGPWLPTSAEIFIGRSLVENEGCLEFPETSSIVPWKNGKTFMWDNEQSTKWQWRVFTIENNMICQCLPPGRHLNSDLKPTNIHQSPWFHVLIPTGFWNP